LSVSLHVAEPKEQIFVSATPGVVNTHSVIGRNRAINEREIFLFIVVHMTVPSRNVVFIPPFENFFFLGYEVDFWIYGFEVACHVYYSLYQ